MALVRKLAHLLRRRRHATLTRSGIAPQDAPTATPHPPKLAGPVHTVDPMPADFPAAGKQVFREHEKRANRRDSW